jgi:hypothetical protein
MNERQQLLLRAATDRLAVMGQTLIEEGWRPEIIVFAPPEIERISGYKVALVVPIDSAAFPENNGQL